MTIPREPDRVLTINAGSSSLKFALFEGQDLLARRLIGKFERIGFSDALFTATDLKTKRSWEKHMALKDHAACLPLLREVLGEADMLSVHVISHRIVHGGMHLREPRVVTEELIRELRSLRLFAPEHLPAEIALLSEFSRYYPETPQVACFDTAFHRDMPRVSQLLPIPRRYDEKGVRRYGFHGLSYSYLMRELQRIDREAARGKIILAHLGNGASMAAVKEGRGIDTTMAFTPAAGLVMSTRTGDLDPGLMAYFARAEDMTATQFNEMVNKQSGLLGVSELSSDIRDLLARESNDVRAAEAIALFCHQARKWIGALSAALGGLDTLIFSGGIGENSVVIRKRICEGLEFLGIEVDQRANETNAPIISKAEARAIVRVIPTDEELSLAEAAVEVLGQRSEAGSFKPKIKIEGMV
nr:acetate/propionate family kinase [Pedosphaera parvula]